jgi:pyruvate dehydrogenase E1 component alpha subunit
MDRNGGQSAGPAIAVTGRDAEHEEWIGYLKKMMLIRRFEQKADELFTSGRLVGACHVCIGQEAAAVGACAAVRPDDYLVSTHRGHGHMIAKGGSVARMMAELFGKETGYCRGRGGSMHVADVTLGHLGANGIVGGGLPIAVGAGFSIRYRKTDQVVLAFFGDAALNQGIFHESLNMASIFKVPVIFICENNLYGLSTRITYSAAETNIAVKAAAYAMPGLTCDGMDVLAVKATVEEAVQGARAGGGPRLVECRTYRYLGHSKSDTRPYRTREEEQAWQARDPINTFKAYLMERNILDEAGFRALEAEVAQAIEDAVRFAEESPYPDPAQVGQFVYA